MRAAVQIATTTALLARAMGSAENPTDLAFWNYGSHIVPELQIAVPLRKMTGMEVVTVVGSTTGAGLVGCESWIVDRFGRLGARQVANLIALTETAS